MKSRTTPARTATTATPPSTSIQSLVVSTVDIRRLSPDDRKYLYQSVYLHALKVADPKRLDRALKDLGFEVHEQRELKEALKYNDYAMNMFWRGMYSFYRGMPLHAVRTRYCLAVNDLRMCVRVLSEEHFTTLLAKATTESTFHIGQSSIDWVIQKIRPVCVKVANTKLRWIARYDPSFDGEAELLTEAIRVANHYAHFPDPRRIFAYVMKSVYHRASHLQEHHSAEGRLPARKLPEFECPECHAITVLQRDTLGVSGITALSLVIPAGTDLSGRFCVDCAQAGKVVVLSNIVGERDYQSTTVSLDTGHNGTRHTSSRGDGARPLIEKLKDETVDIEHEVAQREFLQSVTQRLSEGAQRFVNLLIEPSAKFDAWARSQHIQYVSDPLVRAHLVCSFLGLEYEDIQAEVGDIIGPPSVFLVQVRSQDGSREHDVVFARNPRQAVDTVASEYRFGSGRDMQRACGKVLVKRLWRIDERSASTLQEGKVLPIS